MVRRLAPLSAVSSFLLAFAPLLPATGDGTPSAHQEGARLSLQDLLARRKKMRDERVGELKGSVDQILRALDSEAATHRQAGLAEQKDRLVALGSECAPLLVDAIDPGENPDDTHPDECIDCGICEPECPVDAIKADTEPGLEKWLSLNAEYAKVWPNITVKKAPPPDSKEWEGKPDKLQYFSPNPGAGD